MTDLLLLCILLCNMHSRLQPAGTSTLNLGSFTPAMRQTKAQAPVANAYSVECLAFSLVGQSFPSILILVKATKLKIYRV